MMTKPNEDATWRAGAQNRHDAAKDSAARWSIVASGAIAILKMTAGLLSGSLALISEGFHGIIDFGSTIVTWFAIRQGAKPADEEHHYGHGKIEAVAALGQTGLLIALSAAVAFEAVRRLFVHDVTAIEMPLIAIGVCLVSIVVDTVRWRHLKRIAKETQSAALAADALHFSSDLLGSIGVVAGLLAVWGGFAQGDIYASLIVAGVIASAAWHLGRETVNTLVDTAPSGAVDAIYAALLPVKGVSEVQSVRVRSVGHALFAEISILVPRILALERVTVIKDDAIAAIAKVLPDAQVTLDAEPRAVDGETVLERVLLIAAKRRIPVHHVTVQELAGRLSVSLDIEVDGRMSLAAAHQIASKLETAIEEELGNDTEVETHIEPLEAQGLLGEDADGLVHDHISATILDLEKSIPGIGDVHSMRVRKTERGLVVSLHVYADADRSVEDVHHAVDELERAVKKACPEVLRIVSHAEPIRHLIHEASAETGQTRREANA